VQARRVLIVGAGLAGLTAAHRLASQPPGGVGAAGEILVVEAGRALGGRLATRRIGRASLDHGAQFFTVRSGELRAEVDHWLELGLVGEWCRGFSVTDGYPRYRVTGGMNALAQHLRTQLGASGVEIVCGHRVSALIPGPDAWTAVYDGATREPDDAAAAIVTPPIPQSLELLRAGAVTLAGGVRSSLEAVAFHRVLALLAVLDRPAGLADPGALQQPTDPMFTFVADNQAKGVSDVPAVTFHTAHELSARLWPDSDTAVAAALLPSARALVAPAEIVTYQLKRWRYAGPITPHAERCVVAAERPGRLVLAGDGFAGSRFEGAFLSGLAAADAVTGRSG
jgi:predicted NAD/FAD-dependent oxidoreductase